MIDDLPILGISGWSGSGKTTLIEQVVPILVKRGLKIVVVKHDAHGIDVDRPGKDSDRFFRAGADVLLQGPEQEFLRLHRAANGDLVTVLAGLAERCDLVLVEGHKSTPFRKVWLLADDETSPPENVEGIAAVLSRDTDRLAALLAILEDFLSEQWLKTPIIGCVMIGGKSTRMGSPKHLLQKGGKTWLGRTAELLQDVTDSVVVAGAGEIPSQLAGYPRLTDVPDAEGPMSGLLAAMRWSPRVSWLVAACDLPNLSADALKWLVSTRRPGVWATMPRLEGSSIAEPLLAHYDFRCLPALQQQAAHKNYRLLELARYPKVASPEIPPHLASAWNNVNSPSDLPPTDASMRNRSER